MDKVIKKLIYIIIILVIIVGMVSNISIADEETGSLKVVLSTGEQTKNGTKVTYNFKITLSDFVGINEGSVAAVTGIIDYDKTIFENPKVSGANGWSGTFNGDNYNVVFDTGSIKNGDSIGTISLDLKQDISQDSSTKLSITNLKVAVDNNYVKCESELSTSISVIGNSTSAKSNSNGFMVEDEDNQNTGKSEDKKKTENSVLGNTTSNSKNTVELSNKINNVGSLNKNADKTVSNSTLPKTGSTGIKIILGVLLMIGICIGIRYIVIKRDMDGK